ncbi:unnamed protein product [Caenorhabditis bovis]|uniref:Uncharacterized protein n=1 Tax=Caenorhabditis bovis TaxID=2654633 RepID=A0A8S1F924_9PELO|nr:unnamed protein product [Caenorhabditis bovis]
MINIFNSPIEPSSLDEFADGKSAADEKQQIFDANRRKPKVTYNADGRKIVDGVIEQKVTSNALWSTAITRGVANEWREEATGTRMQKAKRYLNRARYDAQVFVHRYSTPLLIAANLSLIVMFLYICRVFPFS